LATLARDGFLDDTIVVYASDHGELAGEHGLWWKHTWHEAATRVPFYVQTPADCAGDTTAADIETLVGLVDIFPPLCGFAGIDSPAGLDGTDLSGSCSDGLEPDRGPVVCDNLIPRWGDGTEFRLVRDGDYKLVKFRDAPDVFVDLQTDPYEQHNLAADGISVDGRAREALERLRTFVDRTMDFDGAERERKAATKCAETYSLDHETSSPSGNCYTLEDSTIVDADTPLYDPHTVVENPESAFDDYPSE